MDAADVVAVTGGVMIIFGVLGLGVDAIAWGVASLFGGAWPVAAIAFIGIGAIIVGVVLLFLGVVGSDL